MKIFDCFTYLDEDIVLDLRLNYLNNYIDKFVIVESKFTHSGKKRNLNFNIKNFEKFIDRSNLSRQTRRKFWNRYPVSTGC
ncbi:MAG: hypothetical protein HVK37_03885 [Pelagibacteraceae bacterium]|nr:hypothetical protein [Pelagibacteraceae bacterium]